VENLSATTVVKTGTKTLPVNKPGSSSVKKRSQLIVELLDGKRNILNLVLAVGYLFREQLDVNTCNVVAVIISSAGNA
jgi:hypothetical protein